MAITDEQRHTKQTDPCGCEAEKNAIDMFVCAVYTYRI